MTERQREILASLIMEYMHTAQDVGSSVLVSKYGIEVSPATVRNEMVQLTKKGYLEKIHSSAGRRPTALGFRKFVEELIQEIELEHLASVRAKQNISKYRHNRERLIREAVQQLSFLTKMMSVAMTDTTMYYGGVSHLVSQPEFSHVEDLKRIMNIVEDYDLLNRVFSVSAPSEVKVVIGPEIGLDALKECAVIYRNFDYFRDEKGIIAVLGPTRMDYSRIIPSVKFVSEVLSSAVQGW